MSESTEASRDVFVDSTIPCLPDPGQVVNPGLDLAEDLRRACRGDGAAAARVYDQTCADAWLLARSVVLGDLDAQRVLLAAYQEVLGSSRGLDTSLSPRAWLLSRVYVHGRVARALSRIDAE